MARRLTTTCHVAHWQLFCTVPLPIPTLPSAHITAHSSHHSLQASQFTVAVVVCATARGDDDCGGSSDGAGSRTRGPATVRGFPRWPHRRAFAAAWWRSLAGVRRAAALRPRRRRRWRRQPDPRGSPPCRVKRAGRLRRRRVTTRPPHGYLILYLLRCRRVTRAYQNTRLRLFRYFPVRPFKVLPRPRPQI